MIHSSTVHLVLNLETGCITPQYHVIFDVSFSTVHADGQFDPSIWESLVTSNLDLHIDAGPTVVVDHSISFPFSPPTENGAGNNDEK